MATHKSAEKRARQNVVRNLRNSSKRTKIKTTVKKLYEVINSNDKVAAEKAFKTASSVISKAASKGIMHKMTASRKIARLSKKVHAVVSA